MYILCTIGEVCEIKTPKRVYSRRRAAMLLLLLLLLLYSRARTTSTGFEFKSSTPTTTPADTRVGCKRTTRPKITSLVYPHPPTHHPNTTQSLVDDHYRILPGADARIHSYVCKSSRLIIHKGN